MNKKVITPFVIIILVFTFVGLIGWWMYRWQYETADAVLDKWAVKNGFTVVSKHRSNPSGTGPGVRYSDNTQVIYRIEVEDKDGNRKTGVAKLGSETTGTLSDQIQIDWDEDHQPSE